ncbi:MAG: UDP-N-acetylmuramoyl-L-alanyl-D-glutamate--2,6-diaminopimelate ligase [Aureispira sp.]|nr:UDP-N-acetylmuramoyl-L-alanyl-D-glutamate--2,6-diaminopimelate ligase [Aureispira sp.]
MNLNTLLNSITYSTDEDWSNLEIASIAFDSRKVQSNDVFIAINGVEVDGHQFIEKAIEKGASVVVCEQLPEAKNSAVIYLKVENSAIALGQLAANYYQHPSKDLKLVGITGTNGKTTTATLLYNLFTGLGYKVGLISTVENRIAKEIVPATHTTPDALSLQELLDEMREAGCEFVFMEVSSHAIDQHRIAGTAFTGAVFTNITHDHLDYHKTFKAYIYAKKQFFDHLGKDAFALTNIDDKRGMVMLQNTKAQQYTYALKQLADFKVKILENNLSGLILELDEQEFYTRLVGDFNAYNLLSVYATAVLLGAEKQEVLTVLSGLNAVEGRFDYVKLPNNVMAVIDYAHTPDALEKVLQTIDRVRTGMEQIITVVGCGGDRDKAKRPVMAKVACAYSQQTILTSDNPRTEKPEDILKEMEDGVPPYTELIRVWTIVDRREAIKMAGKLAKAGDIILIAGKGHEKYQEVNGEKFPFDDKVEIQKAFEELKIKN